MRRDGLGKSRSVSNSATGPWRLALQGGDQKRAELACAVLTERRSDARIPLFGRRAVLEHFLGLEKETERSDWTNSLPLKLV